MTRHIILIPSHTSNEQDVNTTLLTCRGINTTHTPEAMILGCLALLRKAGMSKEGVAQHYERLLEHHHLTADQVSAALPGIMLNGGFPPMDEARAHLLALCPDLEGQI